MTESTTSLNTFILIAPELALVAAAIVILLSGAFLGFRSGWMAALLGIAVAGGFATLQPADTNLSGPLAIDLFSGFIRWMVLSVGALLALVLAGQSRESQRRHSSTTEEGGVFLLLLCGLSLVGAADDLVLLFAGLELISIPTYILLATGRTDARGQEASLKYFYLSLMASGLFLYGIVCLYGIGGSTSLAVISDRLRSSQPAIESFATSLVPIAVALVIAGATFRMAAVPMHFYAPDVYEGTSPGNAALLSTLPKVAGVIVIARLLALATGSPGEAVGSAGLWHLDLSWKVLVIVAALTMTIGNVMALVQSNMRRLLACSSIAHAGYLLVGVAVAAASDGQRSDAGGSGGIWAGLDGLGSTLFYLSTYVVATVGTFAVITFLGHKALEWKPGNISKRIREEVSSIDDLAGLSTAHPVAAFSMTLFLLSLAGIPPLPGFWGKLMLVVSSLEVDWLSPMSFGSRRTWFVVLAVTLVLNAAIAAAYYLKVIAAMYFKPVSRGVQADGGLSAGLAMLLSAGVLVMVTLQPQGLFASATRAGSTARNIPGQSNSMKSSAMHSSSEITISQVPDRTSREAPVVSSLNLLPVTDRVSEPSQ